MWCDAAVGRVDEIEEAADPDGPEKEAHSRQLAALIFVLCLEKSKKMGLENVDAVVYMTDGYGPFLSKPPQCITAIWGNISPPVP